MTHTDPEDPADDRIGPGVGIVVVDSVTTEQPANRTARWRVWLQGGYLGQPLIAACRLSGSARLGTDFQLAPATPNPTEVGVTLPPGQPAVEIALDTVQDLEPEWTETVTLTLTTNASPCEIEPGQSSATVWILGPYTKTFITVADFNHGVRIGLLAAQGLGDGQLQFQSQLPSQFPFLAVACSGQGTLVRINTTNGQVVGEYLTAPAGLPHPPDPSRTTVDQFGNICVANRRDTLEIRGRGYGSMTRIGLTLGGSRFSKSNGAFYPDPDGLYIALSNAGYNTCLDRDGDGFTYTSQGLADILPWTNRRDPATGVDSAGGVSSAEDEAITAYVRVPCVGTRTVAVDRRNEIWVGGF